MMYVQSVSICMGREQLWNSQTDELSRRSVCGYRRWVCEVGMDCKAKAREKASMSMVSVQGIVMISKGKVERGTRVYDPRHPISR